MAKSKAKKAKDPKENLKQRFKERIRELGEGPDAIAHKNERLNFHTVRSWWDGNRVPRPVAMVDLAIALKEPVSRLMDGIGFPPKFVAEVERLAVLQQQQ